MIDQSNTNVINILKYNINNKLWMRNYHDHIIRDNESYQRIKKYIINNPKTWNNDTLRNP